MLRLCSSSSVARSFKPPLFLTGVASLPSSVLVKASDRRHKISQKKKIRYGICRAEFSQDAPFAAAIGACMLSSLVLPIPGHTDEESGAVIDSTDTRFAVMGIISFVPYFNWLSWVFAWLDTGKRRYAVYALVYLAPYLRSNLSLSPEDSWLPIASIVFCIIHIQLEASLRNGDIRGFQFFNEASKHLSTTRRNRDNNLKSHDESSKEGNRTYMDVPPAEEESRKDIQKWGFPKKPTEDRVDVKENWDEDERRKH